MKNKFYTYLLLFSLGLFLVGTYIYIQHTFKSSEKNIEKESALVSLNSDDLVASFFNDETKSNKRYTGKIIEVTGFVKEISFLNNRITLILSSNTNSYGVICDVNSSQKEKINKLKKNQKILVKGICKGFLKDVILQNCYIDILTNE